jgi:hypothetical protein
VTLSAHTHAATQSPVETTGTVRARRARWWLLLPVALVTYAVSFSQYPVLEERYDVLGDGDTGAFAHVISDFSFTKTYGDPYRIEGRSTADVAQKHKVHHLPYIAVAAGIFEVLRPIYEVLGFAGRFALYAVNALIVCVNLVLLRMLLVRHNPAGNAVLPFLVFYAFALSTWVFASVPESWPFSATLVLAFFLALRSGRISDAKLAMLVGVLMLNNVMLGVLVNLIALRRAHLTGQLTWRTPALVALFSALAIGTWAVLITALSPVEPMLRPDHFIQYTLWFREFTARSLPLWDPYVWKSALSNLYITSIVSYQPDPHIPQEALLLTLRHSLLGLASTAALAALAVLVAVRIGQQLIAWRRQGLSDAAVITHPDLWPAAFCALMGAVTGLLYYSSGFLYSTLVVPLIAVTLCRYLDLSRRADAVSLYASLGLVLLTNAGQVVLFGRQLASLSAQL